MSCIHFGTDELANIARIIQRRQTNTTTVFKDLARLSKANTKAFNHRYPGENAKAFTAEEIGEAASNLDKTTNGPNLIRACHTAALIPYNCDEGVDQLAATRGASRAMQDVLVELMFAQVDKLEAIEQETRDIESLRAQGVRG